MGKYIIDHINEWNWNNFQRWLTWAEIWLAGAANMGLTGAKQPLTFHSTLALFCLECQFSCSFLKQEVHNYNFSGVFPVCLSVRGGAFRSVSLQARNVGQIPPPTNPTPQKQGAPPLTDTSSRPPKGYWPRRRIVMIDLTPCKAGRSTVDTVQRERWMHETE